CDLLWQFSLSGLPQMLMLLLLTCGLFFAYQALEKSLDGRLAMGSMLVAGFFFCLMALAHWLAVWLVIGYAIFAAVALRPRGLGALLTGGMLMAFSAFFILRNMEWTGNPVGTAGLSVFGGLVGSEESLMRAAAPGDETYQILFQMKSLVLNITSNILRQADQLYVNLGSLLAAPMFFFSLLHSFKRPSIAHFRWLILLMWFFGVIGVAIFGQGGDGAVASNQIHILFAPIMAAYGLAFASILWSRLDLPAGGGNALLQYGHFVIIIFISAGPLMLQIPRQLKAGLSRQVKWPEWPPYFPKIHNVALHGYTTEEDVVVSDQPWAVAWYADRVSIWLPRKIDEFDQLEREVQEAEMSLSGVLVSPSSFEHNPLYAAQSFENLEEFAPLMLDAPSVAVSGGTFGGLRNEAEKLNGFNSRYPHAQPLFPGRMTYYASQKIEQD
ncbi:MAG: hypothetical protein ACQKBY_08610, partial [Verrucomicrobiales bacterium]